MYRNEDRRQRAAQRGKLRFGGGLRTAVIGLVVLFAAGCSSNLTLQAMGTQPRCNPLGASDFLPNGQCAQPLVPDIVARGHQQDDTLLYTGKVGNQYSTVFPFPVTQDVLQRGQERFNIYCSPCHGETGSGNGIIVQRGFSAPPTFHQPTLRDMPVGQFFDVITNGFGSMPSYAPQVPVRDRWAIIAYIRALQLSQNATINDVPPDQRQNLGP